MICVHTSNEELVESLKRVKKIQKCNMIQINFHGIGKEGIIEAGVNEWVELLMASRCN
jgi:hypothetical protein